MKHHAAKSITLLGALALACASPSPTGSEKVDPSLAGFERSAVPADVATPTFVDFGGKLHLVGWEVSPKSSAGPGTTISLKLYWRPVKKLTEGFRLYTHLAAADGTLYEFDDVGPLRETVTDTARGKVPRFPPSAWTPGKVYVDEQSITVPKDVSVPTLTLSVGVKSEMFAPDAGSLEKVGEFRLEVISGVSDGKQGALIARLQTGRRGDRGAKDQEKRRRLKPGADAQPGAKPDRGTLGGRLDRALGLDKENPQ